MAFVACRRSTGTRIDITTFERPREQIAADDVVCQLCAAPMVVRAGLKVRAHFAHKPHSKCASSWLVHPESAEHRLGKYEIVQQLLREMRDYSSAAIEYEVPLRDVNRIADVMITFPCGWRIAHECQLAGITIDELATRSEDYLRAGVDVLWWLGKSANTPANRAWVLNWQGFLLELEFYSSANEETSLTCAMLATHRVWQVDTVHAMQHGATSVEVREPYPYVVDFTSPPSTYYQIREMMKSRDVRRTFEIWDAMSHADVMRGLALDMRMGSHVSGVLGSLHGAGAIARRTIRGREKWVVINRAKLPMSHAWLPFSSDASTAARRVARERAAISMAVARNSP